MTSFVQDKKVTVITAVYNSEKYLSESMLSVVNQTFTDWELILVDDCSSDSSISIIKDFVKNDSRIKLIQLTENSGAAVARNVAILAAQGRYIAFLDSDDLWKPNKLEKQLLFMELNKAEFSYTAYEKITEYGEKMERIGVPCKLSYSDLLKTCSIGCLTVIYDTQSLGKVTMPLIRKRQDFALWLKLLKKVDFAYGLNEPLASYREHSESISANKFSAALYTWRLYREVENLSILKAGYCFGHYMIRGVLRRKFPKLARKMGVLE